MAIVALASTDSSALRCWLIWWVALWHFREKTISSSKCLYSCCLPCNCVNKIKLFCSYVLSRETDQGPLCICQLHGFLVFRAAYCVWPSLTIMSFPNRRCDLWLNWEEDKCIWAWPLGSHRFLNAHGSLSSGISKPANELSLCWIIRLHLYYIKVCLYKLYKFCSRYFCMLCNSKTSWNLKKTQQLWITTINVNSLRIMMKRKWKVDD